MNRPNNIIREGFMQEMERMRTADLTTDEGFKNNIVFHLGYLGSTVYELLARVEALENHKCSCETVLGGGPIG